MESLVNTLGWTLIGVLALIVGLPILYVSARLIFLAYFRSRKNYEENN